MVASIAAVLVIGAVIGAVSVAGSPSGGAASVKAAAARRTTSIDGVRVPTAVSGLTVVSGTADDYFITALREQNAENMDFDDALYAGYTQPHSSVIMGTVILVALSTASDTRKTYGDDGAVETLDLAFVKKLSSYEFVATDVIGGAMVCGDLTMGGADFSTCAWIDGRELGIYLTGAGSQPSSKQVAGYAQELWTASERG